MASKTKKSAYANQIHGENRREYEAQINKNNKNHVSETDLSPGGFPFHFKGPAKQPPKVK